MSSKPLDQGAAEQEAISRALKRADELDDALIHAIGGAAYRPFDYTPRSLAAVSAASVAVEHGRAVRALLAEGLPTAALSLLRLQHEALTRGMWLFYAAPELAIDKLTAPLSREAEAAAGKLPMMAMMLKELEGKAPEPALAGLRAFKDNNSPALNSFVHGGIHALQRHAQGYPPPLVVGALRNANGLSLMTAMLLAALAGQQAAMHKVGQLQVAFAEHLPPP